MGSGGRWENGAPRPPSRCSDPVSPPRVGARGGRRAGAAVPARPVRGRAAAHSAEEPGVQPRAGPDGGRPAAGERRRSDRRKQLPGLAGAPEGPHHSDARWLRRPSAAQRAFGPFGPVLAGPRKMPQTLLEDPEAVGSMPHRASGRATLGKTESSGTVGALQRWECRRASGRGRPCAAVVFQT